jgi:hypothetical protein
MRDGKPFSHLSLPLPPLHHAMCRAEVKRSSYDQQTASFVTDPHDGDPSFVRIGEALSKALAEAEVSL